MVNASIALGTNVKKARMNKALALAACMTIALVVSVAAKSTVHASSASEFIGAMRDPEVSLITLAGGVFNLDAVASSAPVIGPNRHVDIVGNASLQSIADPSSTGWLAPRALAYATSLDFGANGAGMFRLADNTTVGFRDLILVRGLSQLAYDWQVVTLSQPSARASVQFTRTIKLREGCLPLQIFVQHVNSYTRLDDSPGQQSASLQPFCFAAPNGFAASIGLGPVGSGRDTNGTTSGSAANVTCMQETLAITDLATSITRTNGQSYKLYEFNSTYWCRAYASMTCLSGSGPEQCVRDLFRTPPPPGATANGSRSTDSASSSDEGGNKSLTQILLPAVLTGTLVVSFVVATFWCMHRRGPGRRGSSLGARPGAGRGGDEEQGAGSRAGRRSGGAGARMGSAISRLLPWGGRGAQREPNVSGYVPVVSTEALDKIAKIRTELSSKMVVASSADDLSDVRNLCLVGKGTFGRVYKGEWKGVTVALKVISVPVSQYGQAQWQQVLGEAAIATLLNHPCVLQTYSVALLEYAPARKAPSSASDDAGTTSGVIALLPKGPGEGGPGEGGDGGGGAGGGLNIAGGGAGAVGGFGRLSPEQPAPVSGVGPDHDMAPFYQLKMVSEFCEGGSAVNALRHMHFYEAMAGGGSVRIPAILDIASQVASGMAYLHSANIIHADLKAANVLLKQQPGSGRLQAKVADFGLSFRLDEPEATHATKGQLGSITHMAPEVLVHGRVSKSSDVYSFGILLYELYTGQQAYLDVPQPMLAYHVATSGGRPQLPPHCPAAYRAIAKECWSSEPGRRPTFNEVYGSLQTLAEALRNRPAGRPPPTTTAAEATADAGNQVAAPALPPLAPRPRQGDPGPAASPDRGDQESVFTNPLEGRPDPDGQDAEVHGPADGTADAASAGPAAGRIAPPPSLNPALWVVSGFDGGGGVGCGSAPAGAGHASRSAGADMGSGGEAAEGVLVSCQGNVVEAGEGGGEVEGGGGGGGGLARKEKCVRVEQVDVAAMGQGALAGVIL